MAATAPERSRTLHNFSLPPRLNWGTQKLLRCSKLNPSSHDAVSRRSHPRNASLRSTNNDEDQIDVIREKLMLDLRSEVDKMRAAILGNPQIAPPPPPPWNLRTRRSPARTEVVLPPEGGFSERAKFSVALLRHEIEDDFVEMVGRRPPRKPKKRPRYIQKELDTLFPGLWLSEITADMYKVNDNPETSAK